MIINYKNRIFNIEISEEETIPDGISSRIHELITEGNSVENALNTLGYPWEDVSAIIIEPEENVNKKMHCLAAKHGCVVSLSSEIEAHRQSSLWYGGEVASVSKGNCTITVEAIGDVIGSLFNDDNEEIARVKDKRNGAGFYSVMAQYIADDNTLYSLEGDDKLQLDNNNWWEVCVFKNGKFLESFVDDDDKIYDVVENVIEEFDFYINGD